MILCLHAEPCCASSDSLCPFRGKQVAHTKTCLCRLLLLRWDRWYSIALQEPSRILYCPASTVVETYRRQMQFGQDDSAEATTTSTEHNGRGRGRGRSKAQKAVVHQPPLPHGDEQRLVELDSTIAAAEAVWRSPAPIAEVLTLYLDQTVI